jgi:hypothetical protein
MPETLLDHPALAGRTVFVRRGPAWESFTVRRGGGLSPIAGPAGQPPRHGWRVKEEDAA